MKMQKAEVTKALYDTCAFAVVRVETVERGLEIADGLLRGGVPAMEISYTLPNAGEVISGIQDRFGDEMLVGAGTVLTTEQVDEAMAAGAQFIVTPGMDPDIVAYCQKVGIQIFPGCTTPTDYHTAYKLGLEVLKFFPAEQSGGISLKNLADYVKNPVIAACGGSYMVTADLIEGGKWDEITDLCKQSVEIVKAARNG